MAVSTMVDPIDDIARQARQGSVAAIIQILNERLADSGVRTRAMFADGVLQLLCEASKTEQLEQSMLVDRVRQILERISPRSIRRVNINSRIVREQQLLWLDEIHRDPENQLLWSEEIVLAQPNPLQRFWEDLKARQEIKATLPTPSPRTVRAKQQFQRGIWGGVSLSLLLLLISGLVYRVATKTASPQAIAEPSISSAANTSPAAAQATADPFVQAVRMAEQAARDGKAARSSADWLALATQWQRASDLMNQVPAADQRYKTARDRTGVYRKNSQAALQQAETLRSGSNPPSS